jgi:hypothetical protein
LKKKIKRSKGLSHYTSVVVAKFKAKNVYNVNNNSKMAANEQTLHALLIRFRL